MYGFTELHTLTGQAITAVGVIFLIIFIYYELKQKYPIFNIRLCFKLDVAKKYS